MKLFLSQNQLLKLLLRQYCQIDDQKPTELFVFPFQWAIWEDDRKHNTTDKKHITCKMGTAHTGR